MYSMLRNTVLLVAALGVACSRWQHPDMSIIATPEFAGKVETYGGRQLRRDTSDSLGMVYSNTTGTTCDDAVAKGLRSMIEQAKALGGERVIHVQAKKAYNWSGELLCRGRSIYLRGIAMPGNERK